jgi:hypothetical protein
MLHTLPVHATHVMGCWQPLCYTRPARNASCIVAPKVVSTAIYSPLVTSMRLQTLTLLNSTCCVPSPALPAAGCSETPASAGFTLPANAVWACGESVTAAGSTCAAQCPSGYSLAGGPWVSSCTSAPAWQAPVGTPITCTEIGA